MEENYLTRAAKYLADLRKRRIWKKIVSGLGAVVVFCTVYALILPAITMTRPTICGQEEHMHDASCYAPAEPVGLAAQAPAVRQMCSAESVYADVPESGRASFVLHVHDESCYRDGVLACTLPEVPEHVHDESCYTEVRRLICGQEETVPGGNPIQPIPGGDVQQPAAPVHQHTDACYEDRLVCGQEETAGHTHTGECYRLIPGLLICTNTEEGHIHDESCYAPPERQLVCGQEEAPAHVHTPACYQRQLICTQAEGQPDTAGYQNLYGSADMGLAENAALEDGGIPMSEMPQQPAPAGHVHTDACYETVRELTCTNPAAPHEHTAACYNELGELACGRQVVRSHVHSEGCFIQAELPAQPENPERTLICGKIEHTHDESCYEPKPAGPSQEQQNWDAIFWSNTVMDASDAVLESSVQGVWKDSSTMDQELLAALHSGASADLTRFLDQATIQVNGSPYNADSHGPMDAESPFAVDLSWTLDESRQSGAGTMTYHYQFPEQIQVEDIERRALSDSGVEGAVAYSVQNNQLSVTYRVPVESVSVRLVLRASWAPGLGENARVQWSNGAFTDVTFAKPQLTVEKTMGEDGLRVSEDGAVWADYTVTVTNSGAVAAREIALTDTLTAEHFHFCRGGYGDGAADYAVTAGGAEQYESFAGYDGGNTLTFPAFDLAAGESRVFKYMARMSAADRESVDAAIKAAGAPDPILGIQTGKETVSNTAKAVCGGQEFTATSQATYGGPASKHVEDFTQTYSGETFDVTFTVNGDAQLPAGMTAEKLDAMGGEGLALEVKELDEASEEYQSFAKEIEPETDETDSQLLDFSVLGLELRYNGVALDLADCEVEASVTPNEALKNYREPLSKAYAVKDEDAEEEEEVLGDKGFGIELKAFSLEEKTTTDAIVGEITAAEPVEEGSVYLDMGEGEEAVEQPVETEPVTFAVESGIAAFSARQVEYPTYTVDFYANLERLDLQQTGNDETSHVTLIDTSGRKLPRNSLTQSLLYVGVSTEGADKGVLSTRKELTHIFNNKTICFNPAKDLDLGMFNVLEQLSQKENPNPTGETNYKLSGFIITKQSETTPTLTKNNAWPSDSTANMYKWPDGTTVYPVSGEASGYKIVTLEKDETPRVEGQTVYMPKYATITMIFEPTNGTRDQSANFYDYDITDGNIYSTEAAAKARTTKVKGDSNTDTTSKTDYRAGTSTQTNTSTWYANILKQGINSDTNYGSGSGGKLAFGNGWPTGLEDQKLDGYNINIRNDNVYKLCSFGLVSGYENGQLVYNVRAPKLFNEPGNVTGKTSYSGYQLEFKRTGDTYTMSTVKDNTAQVKASNLDKLTYQRLNWTGKLRLYSNEFWPMDNVASHGTNKHDLKFGLTSLIEKRKFVGSNGANTQTAPEADWNVDHNAYFGMQFNLEFTVPKDYVGPLDYSFFGDDDLWLFLEYPDGTNELVCDIGGVHNSVGEYVNLRDYIPNGTSGTYKLHLFYTERGASGSTCWMQYTLPGIRSLPTDYIPADDTGSLRITKTVDTLTETSKSTEFPFELTLSAAGVSEEDKIRVATEYTCTIFRSDDSVYVEKIPSDGTTVTVYLKANESAYLEELVPGMTYTIKEQDEANAYKTKIWRTTYTNSSSEPVVDDTFNGAIGKEISGQIEGNTNIQITYENTFYYALPETGGPGEAGALWYTMAALPTLAAAGLLYKKSRKKGGTYPF